jgi:hypothetical protein
MAGKIRKSNLHDDVKTMVTDMISEQALDSANFDSVLSSKTTDDITEGSTNQYYTSTRANSDFDARLATKDTGDLSEGSNLYYTDTRADARIAAATTADLTEGSNLYYTTARGDSDTGVYIAGNRTYGNITTTGYIAGPATMTIDPAAVGDNTGTLVVAGNLQVDGTTTTINSTTLEVEDKNVVLGPNAANDAANNGAGLTVTQPDTSNATLIYDTTSTQWEFNKDLDVTGDITVSGTVDGVDIASRDSTLTSTTTTANAALPKAGGTMTGNVAFGDNDKAIFGAGSDLQIYHTGSTSYIEDAGQGNLLIKTDGAKIALQDGSGNNMLQARTNGAVELAYLGVNKLATTSTGVDITGTLTSDGLTVDGNGELTGASPKITWRADAGHDYAIYTDSASTFNIRNASTARNHFTLSSGGDISFYEDTGTTAKFFWDASAESLGIGTTTPAQKLDVVGNIAISQGSNYYLTNNTGFSPRITNSADANSMQFFQANTERMRIHSEGYTELKSSDAYNQLVLTPSGTNAPGSINFNTPGTGRAKIKVQNNEYISILSTGNVGIGTESPAEKLTIYNGNILLDGPLNSDPKIEFHQPTNTGEGGVIVYNDADEVFTFASRMATYGDINFAIGMNDGDPTDLSYSKMLIRANGNVGIGNTDPTDKLTMTVGNGGGILQSTYYSGTATSGQKLGVIGFKGYSQGNTVAGADAKIEAVAAGNHSGTSAPATLDFYTKPESIGPGSAAVLRHRIHEEGHQTIFKGTNNWSVQRHNENSGCYVCHRIFSAGSSTTTYNLLRFKRHYWGSGSVKFTLSQTYYSSTSEGEYWLTGYGRNDGSYSPTYNLAYVEVYNGPGAGRLSLNLPGGSPGNSAAEIVDVSISIPAYYYYMVRVEVSHSEYYTTTSVMGANNSFALFT